MSPYRLGLTLALSFVALGACAMLSQTTAAEKSKRALRHIVLYKFKDDQSPQQIQEVVDAFAGLPGKIDTIIGFEKGVNVSAEGKSEGLTHSFSVTFRDEAGLKTYLDHPAHLEYVKLVRDRREKVVVFDYWVDQ